VKILRGAINVLKVLDRFLGKAAEIITALAVFVQMVLIFVAVCFRYFLNSPLTWSDELSSYLLVVVTFFGAYGALRLNLMAKIELAINSIPIDVRRFLVLLANLATFIFVAIVIYSGVLLTLSPAVVQQKSPALGLPMYWVYVVVPLASIMMVIHLIVRAYETFYEGER